MAARRKPTARFSERPTTTCRDCELSYDWHSKALDGHLILCRCPHKQQGGKFCIFLSDPTCEHYVPRTSEPTYGKD